MTPEQLTAIIEDQIEAHREQLNTAADRGLYDGDTIKAICVNVVAATLHPPLELASVTTAALAVADAYHVMQTVNTGEHVLDDDEVHRDEDVPCQACDADEEQRRVLREAYDRYCDAIGAER